jgi:hypothetical protein
MDRFTDSFVELEAPAGHRMILLLARVQQTIKTLANPLRMGNTQKAAEGDCL